MNNYQPTIEQTYLEVKSTSINFTADVGVVNSYLVVGYLNYSFDPVTMSLPAHYQVKQGNLSATEPFGKVWMRYGTRNISILIDNL